MRSLGGLVVCATLVLSACSKSESPQRSDRRAPLEGSVVAGVEQVHSGERIESCDRQFKDKQFEIAQALDVRSSEINAFGKDATIDNYERVLVGPTYFRKIPAHEKQADAWYQEAHDWQELIDLYEKIKGQPVDSNWLKLNQSVRSIVMDDQARTIFGKDSNIAYDSKPVFLELKSIFKKALEDGSYTIPPLSARQRELISKNYRLLRNFNFYRRSNENQADRKLAIEYMLSWVDSDLEDYEFRPNKLVTKTLKDGKTVYVAMMDPGIFEGPSRDQIAGFVEDLWASPTAQVEIAWQQSNGMDGIFKILLGEEAYGRAYVDRKNLILQLYPGSKTRTIAHEVGHILGLADRYYTLWDWQTCRYTVQWNPGDLMSDSTTGVVTESAWRELDENYL